MKKAFTNLILFTLQGVQFFQIALVIFGFGYVILNSASNSERVIASIVMIALCGFLCNLNKITEKIDSLFLPKKAVETTDSE